VEEESRGRKKTGLKIKYYEFSAVAHAYSHNTQEGEARKRYPCGQSGPYGMVKACVKNKIGKHKIRNRISTA
jgi:hypothetical protein